MVPPTRFERVTSPLGGVRSIQLSYEGELVYYQQRYMKAIFKELFYT
jgi:hypothetical protein